MCRERELKDQQEKDVSSDVAKQDYKTIWFISIRNMRINIFFNANKRHGEFMGKDEVWDGLKGPWEVI
jgi:hypothetical protein